MSALTLQAPASSSLDQLRSAEAPLGLQAAGVIGFAALASVLAQFEIRLYLWEVPLTLQTLAVYGSGLFLGSRNGFLSMVLYLVLGLVLPVFAGGAMGLDHLLGFTGGYLLAMPFVAAIAGRITRETRSWGRSVLALLAGSVLLFTCGVTGLHVTAGHVSWMESVTSGWLRFIPWDLTKIALVATLYAGARRALA